jgi:hypothetical protein
MAFDITKASATPPPEAMAPPPAPPPPVGKFDPRQATLLPIGTRMPDGSAYAGHPWQDAIMQAQPGGLHGGPESDAAITKFFKDRAGVLTGNAPQLGPQKNEGQEIGDRVFAATGSPFLATLARMVPDVAGNVFQPAGAGGLAKAGAEVAPAAAGEVAASNPAVNAGFHPQGTNPLATGLAGESGRDAATIHNQVLGDTGARNTAGITGGSDTLLTHEAYEAGREGPNSVYNQVANTIGDKNVLPQSVLEAVNGADSPAGGRMTKGSPDAAAKIQALKDQLAGKGNFTGNEIINEERSLKQAGYKGVASPTPSDQELGTYQLKVADILHQHIASLLPADGPVSAGQFEAAQKALAQSHALESNSTGGHLDLKSLSAASERNPGLFTDFPKTAADFAGQNPTVTGRAANIYQQPSYSGDVTAAARQSLGLLSPHFYLRALGAESGARGALLPNIDESIARMHAAYPPRDPNLFAPLDTSGRPPQPGGGPSGQVAFGPTGEPLHGLEPTAPPAAGTQGEAPPAAASEFPIGDQLSLTPSAPRAAPSLLGQGDAMSAGAQPLPPDLSHGVPSHTLPSGATVTPNGASPNPERAVIPGSTIISRGGNGAEQPPTSFAALTPYDDGSLHLTHAWAHPDVRGVEGMGGKQNILDAAQHAQDVNMPMHSDTTLTAPQAGAYQSLKDSGQISFEHQSPETEAQFNKVVKDRKGVVNGNGQPVLSNTTLPSSLGTALGG